MGAANRTGFLTTRVGRRTLGQFLGAALLPVLAVSVAGVAVVQQSLDREARDRALRSAQSHSLLFLGALTTATRDPDRGVLLDAVPALDASEHDHLAEGKPLLRVVASGNPAEEPTLQVWRRLGDGRVLLDTLTAEWLWSALDELTVGSSESYCVFAVTSGERVHCSPSTTLQKVEAMRQVAAAAGSQPGVQRADGLVAAHRDVFLRFTFGTGDWRFVFADDESVLFAPISALIRTIIVLVALAAVAAFAVAHRQIRLSTAPLAALSDATHRVMQGDFDTPVAITSDDEYGELGGAFDLMSTNLSRQFLLLRNMDAIDHATLLDRRAEEIVASALHGLAAQHDCERVFVALRGDRNPSALRVWSTDGRDGVLRFDRGVLSAAALAAVEAMPRITVARPEAAAAAALGEFLPPRGSRPERVLLPLREDRTLIGVMAMEVAEHPEADAPWLEDARRLADRFTLGIGSVRLIERLEALSNGALLAFARAIDANSRWTAGHSERVTALALRLGRQLELDEAALSTLSRGGLMHDIGKIGIPPEVLDKNGRLTDEERRLIEQHPVIGESILSPIEAFRDALPIVRSHHERWDGSGYPDGLAGEDIPWHARILAVADVYDALVSDRPYRTGMHLDKVIGILTIESGSHFDPRVVDALLAIRDSGEPLPVPQRTPAADSPSTSSLAAA